MAKKRLTKKEHLIKYNMSDRHVEEAIVKAKKLGNKGVLGIIGGWSQHHDIEKKINSGEWEVFLVDGIHLLRKVKK